METPLIAGLVEFNYSAHPLRSQSVPTHLHHFCQLDVILAGRVAIRIEGKRPRLLRTGEAVLIAPLVKHAYEARRGWRQGSIKFHLAPAYWRWTGAGACHCRLAPALLQAIEAAGQGWHEKAPLHREQALAVATLGLIELLRGQKRPWPTEWKEPFRQQIWKLLERVLASPYEDRQVMDMARECHLSVDRFSRCFHKLVGQPPRRFLLEARLRSAAAELLACPERPIKSIAEQARYATVHAFTSSFTRIFGLPPGVYRRSPPHM